VCPLAATSALDEKRPCSSREAGVTRSAGSWQDEEGEGRKRSGPTNALCPRFRDPRARKWRSFEPLPAECWGRRIAGGGRSKEEQWHTS
jgi:hypothetical protein